MKIINIVKSNIGNGADITFQSQINTLKKQFQSSNINILLGAGFSFGVAQLLGDIENLYIPMNAFAVANLLMKTKPKY